jgi:hypothetical protein
MNESSADSSEVADFKEVISMPMDGQLPLMVGGHAVNLWAIVYRKRVGHDWTNGFLSPARIWI